MKAKRIIAIVAVFCVSLFASALVACSKRDLPQDTAVTYTVTFDYNYDGAPNSGVYKTETVEDGKTVNKPADPTRGGGYVFDGWSTDKIVNTAWSFSTPITTDVRLYAQWTGGSQSGEKTLSGITVTSNPTKTEYTVGADLDISGLVVTANYADGTSAPIPVSTAMISGYDKNKSGKQTLTVTHTEGGVTKTATFEVTVISNRVLTGIEITKAPTTTEYMIGEDLDLTGLVVTAVYDNETDRPINVTLDMVTGYDKTTAGKQTLTVTYTEDGVTKTATFDVTVTQPKTLSRIDVESEPDKTTYYLGETLDLSGISVKAYFSDSTNKPISVTSAMVSGFNSETEGLKTLTITYTANGVTKTAQFTVNVVERTYTLKYNVGTRGEKMDDEALKLSTLPSGGKKLAKPVINAASQANGFYFVCWKLNGTTLANDTITAAMLTASNGTITVVAEYSNTYTVTFNSNTGSAVASQDIAYGGKVTKPVDPTLAGHVFLDWYKDSDCTTLWNFETDTVKGNTTLYAKYGEAAGDGIYMVGSVFDGDLFTEGSERDKAKFKVTKTGDHYRITNIELKTGDDFKFVSYKDAEIDKTDAVIADYNAFIAANAEIRPAIMQIQADDDSSIEIVLLEGIPAGSTWTIAFGTNTDDKGNKTKYATFTLDGYTAFRDPSNTNKTVVETEDKDGVVYLRGTFSGDFKTCKAWSSESTVIATHYDATAQKYYFGKVYLKKYDDFKVYLGGDNGWYGGTFVTLGTPFELSTTGANIYLKTINDGYYNIIFENGTTKKLTIESYKTVTVSKKSNVYVGSVPTASCFTVTVDSRETAFTVLTTKAAVSGSNTVKLLVGNAVVEYAYTATEVQETDIRIDKAPDKTAYLVGDTIDLTGIKVKLIKNNGEEDLAASQLTVSALPTIANVTNMLTDSESINIKVSYHGFEKTFAVTLKNKLTGISLTTTNVKTAYFVGDTLDTSNLVVTAVFNNNSEVTQNVPLTPSMVEADLTSAGEKQVTVSYGGFTQTYDITVTAVVLTGITATVNSETMPSYTIGEELTKTGITVTASYNNGKSKAVTTYTLAADMNTANTTPVTVTYTEGGVTKTYTFNIDVAPLTVTFLNEDGSTFKTLNVNTYNTAIAKPAEEPTRDHYTFDKWVLTSDNSEYGFATLVTRHYTLKPTWTANTYTVTFDKNGAEQPDTAFKPQTVTYPDKATAPAVTPKKEGHTFAGWGVGSETGATFNFDESVTGNVTLVAKWTTNAVYTVTFYDDDAEKVLSTQMVEEGQKATSYVPVKTGYTFVEWQKGGSAFDFDTVIERDIDLFATWSLNTYTITYNPNNGTLSGVTDNKQTYTVEDEEVTLAEPTRNGYTFGGWFTNVNDSSTKVESIDLTAPKNYNLTAKWTIKTFTVTFDSNGGSAVTGSPFTYEYNSAIEAPTAPTKAGWDFVQWCVDGEAGGHKAWAFDDAEKNKVTGNIKLVAHWQKITYSITYNNDGTVTAENPTTWDVELAEFTLNDAVKTGYTFNGWFTSAEGGTKVEKLNLDAFVGGRAITLHARFTKKTYTVTFDLNYDGLTLDPVTVEYGNAVTAPTPAPERDGFDLTGWYTDADCSANKKWNFATQIVDSNTNDDNELTLYAQWTAQTKQDGIYVNDVFMKALVDNNTVEGSGVLKLKVENVDLPTGNVTFYFNGDQLTDNVYVRGGTNEADDKDISTKIVSTRATNTVEIKTAGVFSFYYDSSDDDGKNGLWVYYHGVAVESNLQAGDGVYNGATKIVDFVLSVGGFNEVHTAEFDLTEETKITVKYGGDKVNVFNKGGSLGTFNDDGTVTLKKGTKYVFYLRYNDNALFIECNGLTDATGSGVYLVGTFSGNTWDIGYSFNTSDSNCYTIKVYLEKDWEFKVRVDGNSWYGFNTIKAKYQESIKTQGVTGEGTSNITVNKTGYYTIEFWKKYSGSQLISITAYSET